MKIQYDQVDRSIVSGATCTPILQRPLLKAINHNNYSCHLDLGLTLALLGAPSSHIFVCCNFFKWANPCLFLFIFGLFKQTLQFLQQIYVKKCPSSKPCWDSNPEPSEHESPPITTRPGLLPQGTYRCYNTKSISQPGLSDVARDESNKI